jgi:hypothetical protein
MRSQALISSGWLLKASALIVVGMLLVGPLSDLATAMQIARASRGQIDAVAMIEKTVEVWHRPFLIEAYRAQDWKAAQYKRYDEAYIANPILSRFVETKFYDNALYFAKTISTEDSRLRLEKITVDSFWLALPVPLAKFIGLDVRKADMQFSGGDYMAYLSQGVPLGSFLTGSALAQGIVLLGPSFPLVYALICCILFWLMDLLSRRAPGDRSTIAPVAMMNIFHFFLYGITADSLGSLFMATVRDFPQMILVYLFVLNIARFPFHQSGTIATRQ